MVDSIDRQKTGVLLSYINEKGEKNIGIERFWIEQKSTSNENISTLIKNENLNIDQIIASRKPIWIETIKNISGGKASLFIEPIYPISQLFIVGAGHIGQALSKISTLIDFETVVMDNRPEQATTLRFPEATKIICKSLTEAFYEISITPETYIVIATQGHRTDIEALKCCIGSCAAYIGVIGSKRKTALIKQEFIEKNGPLPKNGTLFMLQLESIFTQNR